MRQRKLAAAEPKEPARSERAPARRDETLDYIADMAGQLAYLAGAAQLPMLTYFLNMARVEAKAQIMESQPPAARGGRRP